MGDGRGAGAETYRVRGGLVKRRACILLPPLLAAIVQAGCASPRAPSARCAPPAPPPDSAILCVYRAADGAPCDKAGVLINDFEIGRLPKESGVWLPRKPGDAIVVARMADGRDIAAATNRIACVAGRIYFLRIDFRKVVKGKTPIAVAGPGSAVTPLVVGGIPAVRHQPLLQIISEPDARAELAACADVPARTISAP